MGGRGGGREGEGKREEKGKKKRIIKPCARVSQDMSNALILLRRWDGKCFCWMAGVGDGQWAVGTIGPRGRKHRSQSLSSRLEPQGGPGVAHAGEFS